MLAELFADQRRYLNAFFDALDVHQTNGILERLLACEGFLILTGVGKSAYIAEKIAATLVSTGTRARFLSPMDALHGDIGCLSRSDILLLFSKSGESRELLALLPYAQKRGAQTIAVVSRENSQLAKFCDAAVLLPVSQEICPYNLVPTTSAAAQLIFGDCLAVALMKAKQFSMDDLAKNHPAGLLGRKITLKAADLMLSGEQIPFCSPSSLLIDVLHELSVKRCGCLLAVDEELLLQGVFTDGDLRRALEKAGSDALKQPVSFFMTSHPKTTSPDASILDALRVMEEDPSRLVTVLPVIEGQQVVGLLRMHDILQTKQPVIYV